MIQISITTAIIIYLSLSLLLLFSLWLKHNNERRQRTPQAPLSQLYICEYCHFPYLGETEVPVTRCPQCSSMNKDNAYKIEGPKE